MKRADKPVVINIYGDNNKVSIGGGKPLLPLAIVALAIIAMAILAIWLRCPDVLADFVRWIIGKAIDS